MVDLLVPYTIYGVKTQGCHVGGFWVKNYTIEFSNDSSQWENAVHSAENLIVSTLYDC